MRDTITSAYAWRDRDSVFDDHDRGEAKEQQRGKGQSHR